MRIATTVWFCLAYILGLACTGLPIALPWLGLGLGTIGIGLEIGSRRWWRGRFPMWFWATMGGIAVVALLHYQLRLPQPGSQDISRFVEVLRSQEIAVQGTVESLPRLTRSDQMQLWLKVEGLDAGTLAPRLSIPPEQARGRLYVTVPQGVGADVHPGLKVKITGSLYSPEAAKNPGGFDFQQFLQRSNGFAGFRGETLAMDKSTSGWGLWQIQRRIVRSQAAKLPAPEGAIVSAMVLGGSVVDLPFSLKDQFARVGLSHALAASGFQVSLILAVVLALTKRLPKWWQFTIGTIALFLFLGLTGLQPSVCRAVVMGLAVLVAVVAERRVDAIGSLLFATTVLLVANPLWIGDLGFQFSVLATLGLVVTVPWLTPMLTWLPTGLASTIAVPIAAFLWTVPLQLQTFGVISPYSLPVNVAVVPLIVVISLGGVANALIAVIWPLAGSWTALLLHYPVAWLLAIVDFTSRLPGSSCAIGSLPLFLMLVLYGLLVGLWFRPDWRRYGWAVGLAGAVIVWLPALVWQNGLTQVTALATSDQPVLVVQDHGRSGLINSGKSRTAALTVMPFLQQQGVNRLDWAIALAKAKPDEPSGWQVLADRFPIRQAHHLAAATALPRSHALDLARSIPLGRGTGEQLSESPDVVSLRVGAQRWLLVAGGPGRELPESVRGHQVLWWTGGQLRESIVGQIQPQVAIAYGKKLDQWTETMLKRRGVQVFWLQRDGAVQWRSGQGWRSTLAGGDASGALL
jgi:competence protein ComEC